MVEKSIMLDLDDERLDRIADVISNKTAKRILILLSEKEMSESDISKELSVPANTVNYNIKNLESVGLIEKSGKFFWSVKGKKIFMYKLSNKKVVITPKSSLRGIVPAVLVSFAITAGIKIFSVSGSTQGAEVQSAMVEKVGDFAGSSANVVQSAPIEIWPWFLLGALSALMIYIFFNWRSLR